MLLKNLQVEGGLTNGTRGVVVGCESPQNRWHPGCILLKMPAISLRTGSDHPRPLPRVRFTAGASVGGAGAEKTVERVIGPEQWTIDEGGKRLVRRTFVFSWSIWVAFVQEYSSKYSYKYSYKYLKVLLGMPSLWPQR